MSTPKNITTKLIILLVLALAFAATLVALSSRSSYVDHSFQSAWSHESSGDTRRIEKSFTVEPGGQLQLDVDGANVVVSGAEENMVNIVVKAHGTSDKLDRYQVDFRQEGNTVIVDGKQEKNFFHFDFFENSFDVKYEVVVPANFNLTLNTSGGNMTVSNVKGNVHGETSGGEIEADQLDGTVYLSTSGGDVGVKNIKGDIVLKTSGGNITGSEIIGPLDVETSGGNIRLTATDGTLRASTSGGNIHVTATENNGMDLETSGGDVSVMVPPTIKATVDAETTGGDVDCDLEFSGKIKDGVMNGKINGGGSVMKLRSSGGNITISSRE